MASPSRRSTYAREITSSVVTAVAVESPDGKALFEHYAAQLKELGNEPSSIFTGGCADSGFAAATGVPTICAVGPVGGKGHTPEEFMEVDTLVPRAQALALAILRLP